MISLKYIRENKDKVNKSIVDRNLNINVDSIIDLDVKRRMHIQQVEELKAERNQCNLFISNSRKEGKDASSLILDMKDVSKKIKNIDSVLKEIDSKIKIELLQIPNLPDLDVPIGLTEDDNKEISIFGDKPIFKFAVKDHVNLCEKHKLIDFKRAASISGTGFTLYTNKGAKLERALINFMLDVQTNDNGYTEVSPPLLVNKQSAQTTGQLPKFSEDMYYIDLDKFHCIPTAEVPVTNIHYNEIVDEKLLPLSYTAYTPCFRREAGSYGKDTKGLLRLHQFNKVELVKFVVPEESDKELYNILSNAESILKKLKLHYRVIQLCTGDISFSAAKCFDIEVWSPGEKKYLEVSSCSNFRSFQSMRGNIRYRRSSDNKVDFLHTLNGSGLATPRLMVALLETYQNEDGSLNIPEVLIPYFGEKEIR